MSAAPPTTGQEKFPSLTLSITGETIAYLIIAVSAALLRLLNLGAMPLSDAESYHALAALRIVDSTVPGPMLSPASPALFAGQLLSFGVLGASELTARLPVALAGVALVLMPILWRRQMGILNALGFSLLLAFSPTAITAARNSDGATLTAGLAMLVVWLFWHYQESPAENKITWGAMLGVAVAAMLLLVEPGGPLMALCLLGGLLFMAWASGPSDDDDMVDKTLRAFPWKAALLAAVVGVFVISTFFLLYPSGLSAVGTVLSDFIRGVFTRPEGQGFAQGFLSLLLYEPLLWIFGAWGIFTAAGRLGRFLSGWALTGLFIIIFYPGATPAHVLLVVVPMASLAARVLASGILDEQAEPPPGETEDWAMYSEMPGWAMWSYTAGIVALCAATYLNLMLVGREIALQGTGQDSIVLISRFLFAGLVALMLVILFFIIGASWGSRAATKGMLSGLAAVLGLYTISAGAGLAFYRADDPRELWFHERPTPQVHLLAEVVHEASLRATGDPVAAQVMAQVSTDGTLAWTLRDMEALVFIERPSEYIEAPMVILPDIDDEVEDEEAALPSLGDDYVGMPLVTARTWNSTSIGVEGLLMWLLQRDTLVKPQPSGRYVVWLRTDVYGIIEEETTE